MSAQSDVGQPVLWFGQLCMSESCCRYLSRLCDKSLVQEGRWNVLFEKKLKKKLLGTNFLCKKLVTWNMNISEKTLKSGKKTLPYILFSVKQDIRFFFARCLDLYNCFIVGVSLSLAQRVPRSPQGHALLMLCFVVPCTSSLPLSVAPPFCCESAFQ